MTIDEDQDAKYFEEFTRRVVSEGLVQKDKLEEIASDILGRPVSLDLRVLFTLFFRFIKKFFTILFFFPLTTSIRFIG